MKMPVLTKKRTVAQVNAAGAEATTERFVTLMQEDDDGAFGKVIVGFLPKLDWEDMGSPAQVTVSFEPGDLLNSDEPSTP
jgi:hypothetical protein